MEDDTGEKGWRGLTPRFLPRMALLACIILVVISLGVALTPSSPKQPGEPPFSEQARAAALSETLRLRAAGEQLDSSAPDAGKASFARVVTLLTTQARALLSPGQDEAAAPHLQGPPTTSATAPATTSAPTSAAALAVELAASGFQRLADAAVADGGMARLLAAVGTAQLLQASSLAAATGAPLTAPADPAAPLTAPADPAAPQLSAACPGGKASAATTSGVPGSVGGTGSVGTVAQALEAAVRTERQSVYGYELALPRLGGDAAKAAAGQLVRHEALLDEAESLSLGHCITPPPPDAGYSVAPSFLAAPAAGLAGLETEALPVYGDLVALTEGESRRWAISTLLATARATAAWGAGPGPLPGLDADPESFPPLPAPRGTPTPARSG